MKVGILSFQGSFLDHSKSIYELGYESLLIKQSKDLLSVDALILPGGESTAMKKINQFSNLLTDLDQLIKDGDLVIQGGIDKKVTYHDPCYLGRANNIYDPPRNLISILKSQILEMKRSRRKSFCCGAGGSQMFKEPENGTQDININRTEEALSLDPDIIVLGGGVSNIPFLYDEGKKAVYDNVFNDLIEIPILKNSLGDSAGVFGACLLNI